MTKLDKINHQLADNKKLADDATVRFDRVLNRKIIAKWCSFRGSGRYTTDYIVQGFNTVLIRQGSGSSSSTMSLPFIRVKVNPYNLHLLK